MNNRYAYISNQPVVTVSNNSVVWHAAMDGELEWCAWEAPASWCPGGLPRTLGIPAGPADRYRKVLAKWYRAIWAPLGSPDLLTWPPTFDYATQPFESLILTLAFPYRGFHIYRNLREVRDEGSGVLPGSIIHCSRYMCWKVTAKVKGEG